MKGPSVIFDIPTWIRSKGGETWKEIKGYPNYAISDQGRVWSSHQGGRILSQYTNESNTYLVVGLYRDGERQQRLVHSLVAQHFKPERWEEYVKGEVEIHHGDEDPTNNAESNLAYVTREENEQEKRADSHDETSALGSVVSAPF